MKPESVVVPLMDPVAVESHVRLMVPVVELKSRVPLLPSLALYVSSNEYPEAPGEPPLAY